MMVIIINREMAVDTTSELEPPTPPSDGLERDSSPTFDAVLLRHTHTHIRPARFHFCCTKSRRARPSATHYQTAPLRPAPDSILLFFFHHYYYYQRAVGKSVAPVLLGGEVAVAETPFVHNMFSATCVSPVC